MRDRWGNDRERHYRGGRWLPFDWSAIPVTRAVFFTTIAVFLLYFFTGQGAGLIGRWVPFYASAWYFRPWTWFTYPFLEFPSLFVLLTLWVLYSLGGMLERSWGSLNYAVVFFALTAISALAFVPAFYLFGMAVPLQGLGLPLTALITAWASLDPEMEVSYWGVPVKTKLIAAIVVAFQYFSFGLSGMGPLAALFSLAGPAAAYLYVRKMPRLNLDPGSLRPGGRRAPSRPRPLLREESPEERERAGGFNPFRRRQEREEMERLRRLLGDDDQPAGRR